MVEEIFEENQSVYGTRKLKVELEKKGYQLSRRRIGKIMKIRGLESAYTLKQYRRKQDTTNYANITDLLQQEFDNRNDLEVIVSDLSYVRVENQWNYICIILNLYNREIIGYAAGAHRNAKLVYQAISKIKGSLTQVQIFHTDRGSEFNNYLLDEMLETFQIQRSLSRVGTPYDNAVAESTFKIIKTEFVRKRWFQSLEQLQQELMSYVWWFNNKRIHSTLGYLTPVQFKMACQQFSGHRN